MKNIEKTNTRNDSNRSLRKRKSAFTLVELIIVITILAILATIGFMSFQSYTLDARDGKRKRDLGTLRSGLEIYGAKNQTLISPDDFVTISGASLQGYAGVNVLNILRATSDIKDPSNQEYYTYSRDITGKKYQLLAMLESKDNIFAYNQSFINQTYAVDYTTRFPYTIGGNFGIYLSGTTQTPVQEGNSGTTITDTGSLTLITSNTDSTVVRGAGETFTCGTSTVSSSDGLATYNTVSLAGKCWTTQSMKHGTKLVGASTPSDINTIEKWCYGDNDTNCTTYGGLYTWAEAMGFSPTCNTTDCTQAEDTTKSVCGQLGTGWHLPNGTYWVDLATARGGDTVAGWDGNKLGGLISLLPGMRYAGGGFGDMDRLGCFRASEYNDGTTANYKSLYLGDTAVYLGDIDSKGNGYSVICVKD